MKRLSIVALVLFLATSKSFALDALSALPDANENVLSSIEKTLGLEGLDNAKRKELYDVIAFALKGQWTSNWLGSGSLARNRFSDHEDVQVADLIVVNDNRVNKFTFIYFKKAGQIFYSSMQSVETSAEGAIKMFQERKADEEYEVLADKDSYGFVKRKRYLNFNIFHVDSPNAAASYISYGVLDLKE